MKRFLLPILSLAVLTVAVRAEGNGLYRPIPKQGSNDAGKSRFRITSFVPTQYYYLRDSVISYRYTSVASYAGSVDSGEYLGPHGARFVPQEDELPASATVRSFAAVTRRGQPGVGMVAPTPIKVIKKTTKTKTTSVTPSRPDLALK